MRRPYVAVAVRLAPLWGALAELGPCELGDLELHDLADNECHRPAQHAQLPTQKPRRHAP